MLARCRRPRAAPGGTRLGRSGVAAQPGVVRLDHYAPNRHDTGSTTARSVDEVALIRDTVSHYTPVSIALLCKSVAPACREFFSAKVDGEVLRPTTTPCGFIAPSRSKSILISRMHTGRPKQKATRTGPRPPSTSRTAFRRTCELLCAAMFWLRILHKEGQRQRIGQNSA
jgi:hypothetical protein